MPLLEMLEVSRAITARSPSGSRLPDVAISCCSRARAGRYAFKQTIPAPKATLPHIVSRAVTGQAAELGGTSRKRMHDAPPRIVNPRNRLRRAEASLAALEMAMTATAWRATEAEYVYKEKDAVLQSLVRRAG